MKKYLTKLMAGFVNLSNRLSLVRSRTEIPPIFLVIVTVLAVVISLSGLFTDVGLPGRIFQILFLPITIYLVTCSAKLIISGSSAFGTRGGWSKVLRYYCLLVSLAVVVAGLISARTPSEFIVSIVFSALAVYFLISVWPGVGFEFSLDAHKVKFTTAKGPNEKVDVERRDFLKLVGTAGISMFLYNLLFRRDSAPLFGSSTPANTVPLALKNAQGRVIDPAEKSPTEGYYISQIDDADISYFGFVNSLGQWFIMRQDTDDSYRYTRGDKDAAGNWARRSKLAYDYFDNVF